MENFACLALLVWLLVVGFVGVFPVVIDKRRAQAGQRRIPERVFHWLALLGSYGVVLAMWMVRHKTRKVRFLVPFLAANLASLAIVVALFLQLKC